MKTRLAGRLPAVASALLVAACLAPPWGVAPPWGGSPPRGVAQAGETRYHQYTRRFGKTADQARVVSATLLGGRGTEWFAGGGFQADGTVVAAGTSLGPPLDLGVRVTVLGRDGPAPPAPKKLQEKDGRGKPRFNKDGSPRWAPFSWTHENVTGFVVLFEPGLVRVKSAARFPWRAGGVTSAAVGPDGAVYLAGPATDGIAALARDVKLLPVADTGAKSKPAGHVYLAKLSPDAGRVLWVRHMKAPSTSPRVRVTDATLRSSSLRSTRDDKGDVKIVLEGPDIRTFDPDGRLLDTVVVPGGLGRTVARNPVDGTYARGGEHHWRTGREPWRCPVLNIYRPDGTHLHHLYDWGGPYVGLDNLRLVSDSAVRAVTYDDDGNLIIYAWSDGGNSVMTREPNDVRTATEKSKGLGMSAWGAGVLSCSYLIKIETEDYKVAGGTVWLAYLSGKNKPNSIWVDALGFATDGSLCFAGRSAWGLIQTGNKLSGAGGEGEPAGPYVAILNGACDSLRFCSSMPACGGNHVRAADGVAWGIAQGVARDTKVRLLRTDRTVPGRHLVMFVTGAVAEEEIYGKTLPPPATEGAVQKKFGGGFTDAYVVLLDLGAAEEKR